MFMEIPHVIINISCLGLCKSECEINRLRKIPYLLDEYSKFIRKNCVYANRNITPRNKLRQIWIELTIYRENILPCNS